MFRGVSQCILAMSMLYFGSFNPFHYSPLLLYLPFPSFKQLSIYILISSTFTDVMFYNIVDALSLSFPFPPPPSFHRVPLLQTCSTYEFLYDHVYFCVCAYLLDLSFTNEGKCGLCLSEPGLLHLT
jgi:hypothetical protein